MLTIMHLGRLGTPSSQVTYQPLDLHNSHGSGQDISQDEDR